MSRESCEGVQSPLMSQSVLVSVGFGHSRSRSRSQSVSVLVSQVVLIGVDVDVAIGLGLGRCRCRNRSWSWSVSVSQSVVDLELSHFSGLRDADCLSPYWHTGYCHQCLKGQLGLCTVEDSQRHQKK